MGIEGSRVGVVGGSIAGCAAAIALRRAGCEVTVFERSPGGLQDRGFGIGLPVSLRDEFVAAGYLDAALPANQTWERLWIVGDGGSSGASETGRIAGRQPFVAALVNWGLLWRTLRAGVADGTYRESVTVTDIEADADGATVVTDSGRRHSYDLVVGADGYRSGARRLIDRGTRPDYAGYVLWRGSYPESRLPGRLPREFEHAVLTVGFPGGHGMFYLIPDFDGEQRRMNWAVYGSLPERLRFDDAMSLPPGCRSGAARRSGTSPRPRPAPSRGRLAGPHNPARRRCARPTTRRIRYQDPARRLPSLRSASSRDVRHRPNLYGRTGNFCGG
ncbi:hypothetical protein GCM10010191_03640 [Actinomadura vinacea]|uniref:2,6-dihydroxypyridine 3-monooxygenase substrate binding domain-containing protein n=1 Tax=Actinomadura vinacea TaxID=115336 RepID=A0ABN3IB51_9ACTN